jgi:TusA-related sulfurtransferase
MTVNTVEELDCRGLPSSLVVLRAAKVVPSIPWGSTILVLATDPRCAKDFGSWGRRSGNELVGQSLHAHVYHFVLRRGSGAPAAADPREARTLDADLLAYGARRP